MRIPCVRILLAICLATSLSACAGSSSSPSASNSQALAAGSSIETAIVLEDANTESEGVRAEHRWTNEHMPGWKWESQHLLNTGDGKVYDLIKLRKGGETRDVYFDITNWFGKL